MKLFASQPLQYIPSFCKDTVNSWMMSKSLTLAEIFTFIWKRKLSACFNAEIVFQWLVVCNHTTLSPCARAPICSRQCLLVQERISVWLKQTFLTASNFPSSFKFPGFLLLQLVNNCSYGPAGRAGCWQWGGCPALQLGGQRSSPETSYWQVSSNSQAHSRYERKLHAQSGGFSVNRDDWCRIYVSPYYCELEGGWCLGDDGKCE